MVWFIKYSLYGWGMPLLFVIAACTIDNLELDVTNAHVIRPNIFTSCFVPNTGKMLQRFCISNFLHLK